MKTFLFVATLCLFPFQSLTAGEISIDGQTYRLETIQPVQIDSFGRVVPMPPMTVLVPVKSVETKQRPMARTTRTFTAEVAQNRSPRSAVQSRLAYSSSSTPDVSRPVFRQQSFDAKSMTAQRSEQLASTTRRRESSTLLDSRIMQRQIF